MKRTLPLLMTAAFFLLFSGPLALYAGNPMKDDVIEVADIATLFEEGATDGTKYRIAGEVIVTHLQQALRGQLYVQDEGAAILVDDPNGVLETKYALYDGITGLTVTLSRFQEMLQATPVEDPGEPSSTGNTVEPMEVTLDQLAPEMQAMLVVIRDVSFKEDNPETFTHNQSYFIMDATGEGEIRTPNRAGLLDYFGAAVPEGPRDITGVLHQRFEVTRLQPRSLADLQITEMHSIRALRNQEPNTDVVYTLTGEVILTFQHSSRNQKWIQDETAGIMIDDPGGIITTAYEINDGITGLRAKLGVFRNSLQLLPEEDPGEATSSGNEPLVVERTLAEITPDDQGRLVLVNDVMFDESHHGQNFALNQSYNLADESGSLIFRTMFQNVDYFGTAVPVVAQNLTAIVHMFDNTRQVVARSLADFEVAGEVPLFSVEFLIADEDGEPLEGATVTLQEETYEAGQYLVEDLMPGTYSFTISLDGYHDFSGQFVLVSEDKEVDVMLIAVDPFLVDVFPWLEGFEEDFPPEGWSHYQLGDAGNWTTHSTAYAGDQAAHHPFVVTGEANSWLVTPQIRLPDDEVFLLSFFERNSAMGDYGYSGVWISAGSGNPENGHFAELYESNVNRGTYTERVLNLADYMGEVVYIAFVYQGEDAHNWWVDNVQVEQAPDVLEMADIATLVAEGRMDGTVYRITGEIFITHLQQAYRGQLYLQDESAAILVDDPSGIIETEYQVYDGITGFTATMTMFQDMFQLVPAEDPGAPSSTGNTIEPMEVTLSELLPEIQGRLVIVRNVEFKEDNPPTFVHNQSYNIVDATGEGVIRTPNSPGLLDYFGTDVPDVPKDIIGVLHQRFEAVRLQPRSLADFLEPEDVTGVPVTEPREFRLFPNPARDRFTVQGTEMIDEVRVFDLGGRMLLQVSVNDHQAVLQTGGLSNGLYIIQVVSGREVMNQRLQISR